MRQANAGSTPQAAASALAIKYGLAPRARAQVDEQRVAGEPAGPQVHRLVYVLAKLLPGGVPAAKRRRWRCSKVTIPNSSPVRQAAIRSRPCHDASQ